MLKLRLFGKLNLVILILAINFTIIILFTIVFLPKWKSFHKFTWFSSPRRSHHGGSKRNLFCNCSALATHASYHLTCEQEGEKFLSLAGSVHYITRRPFGWLQVYIQWDNWKIALLCVCQLLCLLGQDERGRKIFCH